MNLEARIAVEPDEIVLSADDLDVVMAGLNVVVEMINNKTVDFLPVEIVWHS